MKIVQLSSLYPPNVVGGAEQGVKVITEALAEQGHQLEVITLKGPVARDAKAGNSAIPVHEVPLANIYWPYNGATSKPSTAEKAIWHGIDTSNQLMAHRVQKLVKTIRPDVIMSHNLQGFSTAVLPAIKHTRIPLVHVIHDYSLLCPQTTLVRDGKACGMQKERCKSCRLFTAPRFVHASAVDAVISVSQAALDVHLDHGLFNNIPQAVIYNALKPNLEILDTLKVRDPGHVFTFGYMGRIEQTKGVETMLKAAAMLEARNIPFKLLIAGKGHEDYVRFLQSTYPLNAVEYVGYVNPASFFSTIHTLIFPSEWMEALGNGVFEAFSQGVPVLGSDRGGIPESINHDVNGLVFAARNSKLLSTFMEIMAISPEVHHSMATQALKKSAEYRASNRARQYNDFLRSLVARPGLRVPA